MTLLHLDDVHVTYKLPGRGTLNAVDGVSFDLEPRQVLGLVGESGCGKSTLARAVCGLEPTSGGAITFNGTPIGKLGLRKRAPELLRIQMVFQNPYASLNPRRTIGSQIEDGLRVNPVRDAWDVGQLLEHVELDGDARQVGHGEQGVGRAGHLARTRVARDHRPAEGGDEGEAPALRVVVRGA